MHIREIKDMWKLITAIEFQPDGCWVWNSEIDSVGHAMFRYTDSTGKLHRIKVRRFFYEVRTGNRLKYKGDHIKAMCDYPECINPDHLRLSAQAATDYGHIREYMPSTHYGANDSTLRRVYPPWDTMPPIPISIPVKRYVDRNGPPVV